ncbi:hypothetical protein SAMN02745248_00337 [Hathewaya proteolytica DSM 3090]|uniref:Uncharacterized protein n=1 Tax=Hathewaya proteolytica DSM 3090 TaxID=1121331 RepID=A0A1M6K4W8_9CLOT|nr:hypothetical protein [Hathewaya proteolytica]SHJ54006.1 hypothetical protein SAMN02745248_00337 [Hathewaya proteolytica DSM 3090]
MNEKLIKRLKEVNLNVNDILSIIEYNVGDYGIIYTSHIDGLGTWDSDFDVYIIRNQENCEDFFANGEKYVKIYEIDSKKLNIPYITYLFLDVEYWKAESIESKIRRVHEKKKISIADLKVLLKMRNGDVLIGNDVLGLKEKLKALQLERYCADLLASDADEKLHDATTLYGNGDYYGAMISARDAVGLAICGYNSVNNKLNLNVTKWYSRIFLENKAFGKNDYMERYLNNCFFYNLNIENIKEKTEELIIFVQDILNNDLNFLGKKHWLHHEMYNMLDEENDYRYEVKSSKTNL